MDAPVEQASRSGARVYVLNTPVLTDYGDWRLEGPIPLERAIELVSNGFISAVGHAGTAEWLGKLLGVPVPVNRIRAELRPGDCALVVRMVQRLPEGTVLSADQMERAPFDLAVLTRLA